jgi:hypothetical protein
MWQIAVPCIAGHFISGTLHYYCEVHDIVLIEPPDTVSPQFNSKNLDVDQVTSW